MRIKSKFKAYLQLVRFPNLCTIPGDILVGGLLVTTLPMYSVKSAYSFVVSLFILIFVSLLLYSFGLVQNDLFGFDEDCMLGRKRPLTSGTITRNEARGFATILAIGSLLGACLITKTAILLSLLILITVTLYNYLNQKQSSLSPLIMGGCRGLNILLGASLVGWSALSFDPFNQWLWICVVFQVLYILSVTVFARDEATAGIGIFIKLFPYAITLLFAVITTDIYFMVFSTTTLLITLPILKKSTPKEMGQTVGRFIQSLILLQMIWLMMLDVSLWVVMLVFCLYLLHGQLSKWFYAS